VLCGGSRADDGRTAQLTPPGVAVSRGEVWGHGHDGQVQVARVQRTESDAGITGEQFEHLVPSLPAEAIADPVQRPVCGCVPAKDTQRDRDAGQPGVQRGVREAVDVRAQCIRTSYDDLAVPVIAEVQVCLVQREDPPARPWQRDGSPASAPVPLISHSAAPRARRAARTPRDN
jgi:hypothetical protein